MHTCNPGTREAEAGGSQVPGQPGLNEILSQNQGRMGGGKGRERKGRCLSRVGPPSEAQVASGGSYIYGRQGAF
jgi:hypothetical protein